MAQYTITGMTSSGGDEFGVIFTADKNGEQQTIVHTFEGISGAFPYYTRLCEASNGKLYGMASQGGRYNLGVLFEYDTTDNTFLKTLDFNGAMNGSSPRGSLIQASNGKLYGMTCQGGSSNFGVLFEFDPASHVFTKKLDFEGANGRSPFGNLFEGANGKLYGMTYQGGAYNDGVLFEYDVSNDSFYVRHDFDGANSGRNPFGSLMQAGDGLLYGVTYQGGANNLGVLFAYDPVNHVYTGKLDFDGVNTGSNPYSTLVRGNDSLLYAMAYLGGINNQGTLFAYDPRNNTIDKKVDFNGSNNGRNPQGNLQLGEDGNFYGQLPYGGANNGGLIFSYDPVNQVFEKQVDFVGGNAGRVPFGSLLLASNHRMYGMTYQGGVNNAGVMFAFNPADNSYTKTIDFGSAIDGSNPYGELTLASDLRLYGMTYQGGEYNAGVICMFDPGVKTYKKQVDLEPNAHGSNPYGSLVQAVNGKLYGMCSQGGLYDYGTLIEYDPVSATCVKKLDFEGDDNGRNPQGRLVAASNGKLYGMTPYGGREDYGVLFEYDPITGVYVKLLDFDLLTGTNPFGSLIQAVDGKLYGLTYQGGVLDYGVLFAYDLADNTYAIKTEFNGIALGSYPQGSLLQAENGRLYGLTQLGGKSNAGVLFAYNPVDDAYALQAEFSGVDGKNPTGQLIQSSNGNLYGMTQTGGTNNTGVLFEFDMRSNNLNLKLDFEGDNGARPFGALTGYCLPSFDTLVITVCDSLRSPSRQYVWTTSGIYFDTIPSASGCDSLLTMDVTVLKSTSDTLRVSACDSFVAPDGEMYFSAGRKKALIRNAAGCDSLIVIDLEILKSSHTISETACKIYTAPDGVQHTSSGVKTAVIKNAMGCDSTITIHLTIHAPDAGVTYQDSVITANAVGAVYQWVNCDLGYAPVPGAADRHFTARKNGRYAVVVTENACSDTSECITISGLSLADQALVSNILVYPNPTGKTINIEMKSGHGTVELVLTDVFGKVIKTATVEHAGLFSMDIDSSPGVYLLRIVSGSESTVIRVIRN